MEMQINRYSACGDWQPHRGTAARFLRWWWGVTVPAAVCRRLSACFRTVLV